MFRGTISTASGKRMGGPSALAVKHTIYVFDDALVIAPLEHFTGTRFWIGHALGEIPVVGPFIHLAFHRANRIFEKKREAEAEQKIEELPSDITVEQLGERIEHAHAVPTAEIARLLVTDRFWVGQRYMRVRFMSRDADRYAHKWLSRRSQRIESDPESAKALLREVFGDRVAYKWRTWAKSGRVGTLFGRAQAA
jgi:hypothetical protein